MSPVPAEEPPSERSVSGESGRPPATDPIYHPPSPPSFPAVNRSGAGGVQPLLSRLPCPLKPSG